MPTTNLVVPTSELEAVNIILRAIGESPLDTLDQSFADSSIAQQVLREELRAFESTAWVHNTESGMTLTPDAEGNIQLPQNTMRVVCDPALTQRGTRLYDRVGHTYTFTSAVECDLIVCLQFEELPEPARRFIMIRAGRRFMDDAATDQTNHSFKARDEQAAWTAWLNYEQQVAQWNVLDRLPLNLRVKRYRGLSTNSFNRE